jgi:peptide/nickel transport system permease protein
MRFLARRLVFYIVAAWAALTINFFIPRAMPGNAVQGMMAKFPALSPLAMKALEAEFGTSHSGSLLHQYGTYLINILHGNFGIDLGEYPASVISVLATAIPWTLTLVGVATVTSFVLGTLLGIGAAWRRGGTLEQILPGFILLQATPYFFLALLIIDFLAVKFHLFPESLGYGVGLVPGWTGAFIFSAIYHSILPATTLVMTTLGGWMLGMRNVMITILGEDYVLAAQAKGLSPRRVVITYAARNAILPNFSAFAMSVGFVISGALVMEVVFSYPGVGLLLYNSVTTDDYPMLQAIFLLVSVAVLVANFISDGVYVILDPRSRREASA